MLRNYLSVALRNLVANKVNAVINIGGLAVGLAACITILLYVRDELSYDTWLPNADRIHAVESTFIVPGRDPMAFAGAPGPMKPALDKDFSSDIEATVRLMTTNEPLRVGDRAFTGQQTYVDKEFFQVFDLPMVAGEREAVLADNQSILLSQAMAKKYFGDTPAIGNTITINDKLVFTVIGVFRDLPRNTHLSIDAIALFDTERYKDFPSVAESWTSVNTQVYALLRTPEARARIEREMPAFIDRNVVLDVPGFSEAPSNFMRYELMPILDIHLHADKQGYDNLGSFTVVVAFAGIALLILVIACINFVNLATARAMMRAREVAMRKVVGATRGQLVRQHLGEAVLTALIALVVALALVELTLPSLGRFVDKQLELDLLGDPTLLLTMVALIVIVGVLGGLYPALYLSRFRPASVLKANQSSVHGSSLLRSGLVVFQFAISIALIACTATIYAQTVYARTLDLGFQHDSRITMHGLEDFGDDDRSLTLKHEIQALPGVIGAALSSDVPPLQSNNNTLFFPDASMTGERMIIETMRVDPDFFGVYEVKPLAGRLFSIDHASDFQPDEDSKDPAPKQGIVVNMAFARKLGAVRPDDVVGKVIWDINDDDKPMIETTVVGVVPDLYLRSVRAAVTPMAYYVRSEVHAHDKLTVHVAPGRMRETRREIEAIWGRIAPTIPIRMGSVGDDLDRQYDADEQRGQIFAGFAVFAVVIACLGLFGLAAFSAERRTKEIGMRKVLGASVLDIVRLLVWQFSRPVLIANLIAWPVSFWLMSKWLGGFRYAIDLSSPGYLVPIFGGAALLALAVAWLTTAGHAYKVARANPGRALRVE
jgi:putative ABC transport system permease protein